MNIFIRISLVLVFLSGTTLHSAEEGQGKKESRLNAGTFGPNSTDGTFGPEVVFTKAPPEGQANLSPYAGLQFFGQVDINRKTKAMTVRLKDIYGDTLFKQKLRARKLGHHEKDDDYLTDR